ncbi:MAG: hypothetical protein ACI8PB_001521 [Desulforhopalus sp.]
MKVHGDFRKRAIQRNNNILQSFANKAHSVDLQVPKGSKYEKIILMQVLFKISIMNVMYSFKELNCFRILRMQDFGGM